VNVQGSLGLDDGERLLDSLERSTGLEWRLELAGDDGHLSGGIVEIMLVAVLSKSTELAYGAVAEKVRERVEEWRRGRLDPPEYSVVEQGPVETEAPTETDAEAETVAAQPEARESEG
jgi:hypothetical protein